jgi:hypothetical protein
MTSTLGIGAGVKAITTQRSETCAENYGRWPLLPLSR